MKKIKAMLALLAMAVLTACSQSEPTEPVVTVEATGKVQSVELHTSSDCQKYDAVMTMKADTGTISSLGMELAVPEEDVKSLRDVAENGYTIKFKYTTKRGPANCPSSFYLMTSYEIVS